MQTHYKTQIGAVTALVFIHIFGVSHFISTGPNLVFFLANLSGVFFNFIYLKTKKGPAYSLYLAGWLSLALLILGNENSAPVLSLYLGLYTALFRLPRLLVHFAIFVITIEVIPQYFSQIWPLTALLIETMYHSFFKDRDTLSSVFFLLGFMLIGMILIPVLGILFSTSPQTLASTWQEALVRNALATSLITASSATLVALVFGVPLSYAIARTSFWGKETLLTLIDLPILIPQSVAGIALLMVFGPKTTIGHYLHSIFNLEIVNSLFAITIAQIFVSTPFLIRAATSTFSQSDSRLEKVSRTLGATNYQTFRNITLPLALPGIYSGAILTWARAISEAGTIILLANEPFTISTLVNFRFQQFGTAEAAPIASLLIIVCLFIFTLLNSGKVLMSSGDECTR